MLQQMVGGGGEWQQQLG